MRPALWPMSAEATIGLLVHFRLAGLDGGREVGVGVVVVESVYFGGEVGQ